MTKSKAGYTLVHMLAAIAVIGLTASGVGQALFSLSQTQGRATTTLSDLRTSKALQMAFAETLASVSDYSTLSGGAGHFRLDCAGGPCEANVISSGGRFVLVLTRPGNGSASFFLPGPVQFEYETSEGLADRWPAENPRAILAGIAILSGEDDRAPLAFHRVRQMQARDCEYDSVIRDCRAINP